MSKEKKDILDFLGEEIENQSFEFEASHWDAMEDIIIKDEKKKRRLIYWWFAGSFLLFGVLISSILHLFSDKSEGQELALTPLVKTESKSNVQDNGKKEDFSNKRKQLDENQKPKSIEPLEKVNYPKRIDLNKNKRGRENKTRTLIPKNQVVVNGDSLPKEKDIKETSPSEYLAMNIIEVNNKHLKKLINREVEKTENNSNNNHINEKGIGTKDIYLTTPLVTDPVNLSSKIDKNLENVSGDGDSKNEKMSKEDKGTETNEGNTNFKPRENISNVLVEKKLPKKVLVNVEEKEEEILEEESKEEEFQKSSKFSLVAGVNYYKAFNDPNNEQTNSIDPNIGFVIAKDVTSKIGSIVGMNFYQKSKVNAKREFEYVDFVFGKNTERTTIETSQIYFAQMNFGAYYRIHQRVNLNGSLGIAQVLNTRSEVSEKVENSFYVDDKGSRNSFGYINGYNRTSYNVTFGIDYNITNKLNVGLNYNIGLSDITKDTYYNTISDDRNSGVQLLIKYNLINRKK